MASNLLTEDEQTKLHQEEGREGGGEGGEGLEEGVDESNIEGKEEGREEEVKKDEKPKCPHYYQASPERFKNITGFVSAICTVCFSYIFIMFWSN